MNLKKIGSLVWEYSQLIFAAAYVLCCLVPIVALEYQYSNASVIEQIPYNVFQLSAVRIVQVLIYPVMLIILFVLCKFALKSMDGIRSYVGAALSGVNMIYLLLLMRLIQADVEQKNQFLLQMEGMLERSDIFMSVGYYLLLALSLGHAAGVLVHWQMQRQKATRPPKPTGDAMQEYLKNFTVDDD